MKNTREASNQNRLFITGSIKLSLLSLFSDWRYYSNVVKSTDFIEKSSWMLQFCANTNIQHPRFQRCLWISSIIAEICEFHINFPPEFPTSTWTHHPGESKLSAVLPLNDNVTWSKTWRWLNVYWSITWLSKAAFMYMQVDFNVINWKGVNGRHPSYKNSLKALWKQSAGMQSIYANSVLLHRKMEGSHYYIIPSPQFSVCYFWAGTFCRSKTPVRPFRYDLQQW